MDLTGIDDVINPDTIRSPDGNLASALQAGRIVIQRTSANFAAGRSFLLETTLSGNREARVVAEARVRGYQLDFIQFREGVKGRGDAEQMHERKLG